MNRLIQVGVAVAVFVGAAVSVQASSLSNRTVLSIEGGVDFPTGDLSKPFNRGGLNATTGLHGALGFEQMLGRAAAVGLSGGYYKFGIDEEGLGDVDLNVWVANLSLRGFLMDGPTRPFLVAGVLLGRPSLKGEVSSIPFAAGSSAIEGTLNIDWSFGFHGGVGILYMISEGAGIYVAGEYLSLQTDGKSADAEFGGQSFEDVTEVAGNAEAFSLRAGLNVFFGGKP